MGAAACLGLAVAGVAFFGRVLAVGRGFLAFLIGSLTIISMLGPPMRKG
jgi:hypothetical protein